MKTQHFFITFMTLMLFLPTTWAQDRNKELDFFKDEPFLLDVNTSREIESKIANEFIELNSSNYDQNIDDFFAPLLPFLENKNVVILGETGHGDGKTFEMKTNMIKFLKKQLNFEAVALEGGGFYDFYIYNQERKKENSTYKISGIHWLITWTGAKQVNPLLNMYKNNEIEMIGIDICGLYISLYHFISDLQKNTKQLENINWEKMEETYSYLVTKDTNNLRYDSDELIHFINDLKNIQNTLKQNDENSPFVNNLIISIDNVIKDAQLHSFNENSYEGQNKGISMRDKQMADNLLWYMKNNPDKKIIVWTANFHGAKNINQVRYREEDPTLYNTFKLFAEHLHDSIGDQIYSIGFTSSRGEVRVVADETPPFLIQPDTNSLEYYLDEKTIDFGFMDCIGLRENKTLNTKFNSTILGYDNKPGKWLNVFDGIFYIKQNEKAATQEWMKQKN